MKKLLHTIFIFIMAMQLAQAQQKPQYTQYVLNNLLINPAVTGIENYDDLKTGYRSQWTGLQGAPVTSYITFSAPFGSDFVQGDAASASAGNEANPYSRLYTQSYQASEPHHGLGFTILSDQAGQISTSTFDINYAYHLGLASNFNLALGVGAGLNHVSLNTTALTLPDTQIDPAIANGNNSQWNPDLNVGIWGYSSTYYFGISAQQVLPQNFYFSTTHAINQQKTVPQYLFTAGIKVFLTDDITLIPSALVKVISPLPTAYDINAKIAFRDRFWIGASYRNQDAVAGMVGFNISSLINISYSYDYTTSQLGTVSSGTHEIVIGLLLNNKARVVSPQHSF